MRRISPCCSRKFSRNFNKTLTRHSRSKFSLKTIYLYQKSDENPFAAIVHLHSRTWQFAPTNRPFPVFLKINVSYSDAKRKDAFSSKSEIIYSTSILSNKSADIMFMQEPCKLLKAMTVKPI